MKSIEIWHKPNKFDVVQCLNCNFIDTVASVRRNYDRLPGKGFGGGRCNVCGSEAFTLLEDLESGEERSN